MNNVNNMNFANNMNTNSESKLQFSETELPSPGTDFSENPYYGSMQTLLARNLGNYVECEFLIGTQLVQKKEGFLYSVGVSYVVLYNAREERYVVCDFYSLKFVTFVVRMPRK